MDSYQRTELGRLLSILVEEHPYPDKPTIIYGRRTYSPRKILEEVTRGTEFGKSFGNFLYEQSKRFNTPVEEFIKISIEANKKLDEL